MAEILRLGFAGLGEAATLVLPEISQLPYIRVTAAAEVRPSARSRFQEEYKGRAYDSVEELCASPDVDAIYIATPHELHAKHAVLALENRKHVIVEKPMALSIEDAELMNATAEKYGMKLMCGHTKSFDPPIRAMRKIIRGDTLGQVQMINTWNYNDFMVRPYPDRELDVSHGVVLNQGPHQVDVIRLLGGGLVRSVRAATRTSDPTRAEGIYGCFLEFEDGAFATITFSSYGYFDTAELTWWLGEATYPGRNQDSRAAFKRISGPEREDTLAMLKNQTRYGEAGRGERASENAHELGALLARDHTENGPFAYGWGAHRDFSHTTGHQRFYGLTIVTCEKGEMRQSQDGILLYGDEEIQELPVGEWLFGRQAEITELYEAVINGQPMCHDGRWGEATLEVCLAILQSAAERREIYLSHQVPARD